MMGTKVAALAAAILAAAGLVSDCVWHCQAQAHEIFWHSYWNCIVEDIKSEAECYNQAVDVSETFYRGCLEGCDTCSPFPEPDAPMCIPAAPYDPPMVALL